MRSQLRSSDEIVWITWLYPRSISTQIRIISTSKFPGNLDLLGIGVDFTIIRIGARNEIAEFGGNASVILESQTRAATFTIADLRVRIGCGGPCGLPVHPIEDDQEDKLLTFFNRFPLKSIDVGLVAIVGIGIQRILRNPAIRFPNLCLIPIATLCSHIRLQGSTEDVDRDQRFE